MNLKKFRTRETRIYISLYKGF